MQEDETLQTLLVKVADLKEAVDELKEKQSSTRNELNELTSISTRLQNQAYKAEKDLDILQIQQQALEQESQRNMEDTTNKEAELSHFNEVTAGLQLRVDLAEKDFQRLVEFENNLQEQIKVTENELITVQESIIREGRKLDAKQNEYNLTKSMVDNLEGFPESIRFLKKNADWSKNAPLFSDILFCREEYRVAIENYLEPLMNHYVVDTYNEAIKAINLLSKATQGRAQFFVLDSYEQETLKTNVVKVSPTGGDLEGAVSGAIPALNVVEVEKHYQPLCDHLLRNVYLIDDNNEQSLNNAQLPDGVVLIGKSGKFNKSKHAMAGGSVGLFEGKRIGRAKNLEALLKVIKLIDIELTDFKSRFEGLQNKLSALKLSGKAAEIKQKQQELNLLNTELVTVKTRQEQYQAFIENSLNRKEDIARKIESIKDEKLALQPQLEELKAQKQTQNELLADKQSAFNELNEYVSVQSNAYNQENIRFLPAAK